MNDGAVIPRSKRANAIATVLWVTLALNWLVALLKIGYGFLTHCMVITADGVHSFSDGTSNIIGLLAVRLSGHPADHDHPYGHQKYETLASILIAFFLFAVSFGILKGSIKGFFHPRQPVVNLVSFELMLFTLIINLFVVFYERKKAKLLKSDFLLSDSWHTLTDVFVTLTVFVALFGIYLKIPYVDSVFSLLIAIVILVAAVNILKSGSDVLCDKAVLDVAQIEKIVRSVDQVRDCHEIRTRGRTDDVYIDLHVLVDNEMTVAQSHLLANKIENDIKEQIPGVHDVVVHIEPVSHEH